MIPGARAAPASGYFLNVDKEAGVSSRGVVDAVTRLVGTRRVGHAGTLDPLATGVLVVAVGRGTRLLEYVQAQGKTYRAGVLLGRTSDTDDIEGQVRVVAAARVPQAAEIEAELASFVGRIEQRPPAVSAVKVGGQRAYKLARAGQKLELSPRPVEIHGIRLIDYAFPRLELEVTCGAGTYIRSLARDLGERLGTGGLIESLRRTAVGDFTERGAVTLGRLEREGWQAHALPLERAVARLPALRVDERGAKRFRDGLPTVLPADAHATPGPGTAGTVAVFGPEAVFLGIGGVAPDEGSDRGAGWLVLRGVKSGFADGE